MRGFVSSLIKTQQAVTKAICQKSPHQTLGLYQRLLKSNFYSLTAPCFPVVKQIIGQEKLYALIEEFFISQQCNSPYFQDLPGAFVLYCQKNKSLLPYPFLAELMHYEWIEMYLDTLDASEHWQQKPLTEDDFSHGFRLSQLARLISYDYPVDKLGVSYLSDTKVKSFFIVLRNEEHEVKFIKLNQQSFDLVKKVMDKPNALLEILKLSESINDKDKSNFVFNSIKALTDLYRDQALLTYVPI